MQSMAAEAGFDMKIRVTEFATSLKQAEQGRLPGLHAGLERPHRSGRQLYIFHACKRRRTTAATATPEVDELLDERAARRRPGASAQALYEQADARWC